MMQEKSKLNISKIIELPIKYKTMGECREEIEKLGAKVINVIELKSNKYLLFIVDPINIKKQNEYKKIIQIQVTWTKMY